MIPISASDILKALEALPGWKAVMGLPKRLADLEARVTALEKGALKPKSDATECPNCGASMRFISEAPNRFLGRAGVMTRQFVCDGCNHAAERNWTAGKGYL